MGGSILQTSEYVAGPVANVNFQGSQQNHGPPADSKSSPTDGLRFRNTADVATQRTPKKSHPPNMSAWSSDTTSSSQMLRSRDLEEITRIVKSALHTLMMPEIASIQRRLEGEPLRRWSDLSGLRRNSDPSPLARLSYLKGISVGESHQTPKDLIETTPSSTRPHGKTIHFDDTVQYSGNEADVDTTPSISCGSLRRKLMKTDDQHQRNRLEELIAEVQETSPKSKNGSAKLKTVKTGICTITRNSQAATWDEKRLKLDSDSPNCRRWSDISPCKQGRVEQLTKMMDSGSTAKTVVHCEKAVERASEPPMTTTTENITNTDLIHLLQVIQRNDEASKVRDTTISQALSELREEMKSVPIATEQKILKSLESPEVRCDVRRPPKPTGFLARFKSTRSKEYDRLEFMIKDVLRGLENLREGLDKSTEEEPTVPKSAARREILTEDMDGEHSSTTLPQDYFVKHAEPISSSSPIPVPKTSRIPADLPPDSQQDDKTSCPSFAEQATDELLASLTNAHKAQQPTMPRYQSISVRKPRGARTMTDGRDWADGDSTISLDDRGHLSAGRDESKR